MSGPRPLGLRTHYCGTLGPDEVGQSVAICGWVAHRREHGEHLAFVDVRDHTGLVQCVIDTRLTVRSEYVVRVQGTLRLRPEGTENPDLATGLVELADCQLEVLSEAQPPPFVIDGHSETDETVRLRYRYLDLRSERMQSNLRLRARIYRLRIGDIHTREDAGKAIDTCCGGCRYRQDLGWESSDS